MANTTDNINYKITVDAETGTAVVRDLKGQIIATKVPVKQLREEFGNFAKTVNATSFNKFSKGLSTATKANKNLGDASGAATSSVMELSRVVSDAPYGIRGMANNITQLVSQMGFASKKAGGFGNALKEMGKQFMGPLGIVFLITAAVSALDFFYGAATKAEKATKDLTSQTFALQQVAKSYTDQLQDLNITEERRRVLTKELIKIVPTLKEEDLKYGKNLDEVREKIKLYTLSQANRLEMDKLVEKNSSVLAAQSKVDNIDQIKNAEERLSSIKKLLKEEDVSLQVKTEELVGQSQYGVGIYHKTVRDKTLKEIEGSFQQLKQKLEKESKPVLEKIEELSKGLVISLGKDTKGKGKTKLLEIKDFDKQVEDYLSQIASVSEKEEILNAKLNSEKVLIQEEYHLKSLDLKNIENKAKFKQQSDAYRVEYKAFLDQEVRLGHLTQGEADKKLDKFDVDAKAEQDKSDANYKILLKKWNDYYSDKLFIALSGEMKVEEVDKASNAKKLDNIAVFIEQYKVLMSGLTEFIDGEFERELTIEQNKTNVLNAELNNRLLNENLSKDQRASIQNQIAQNDEKLRVKQEAIKRKAFNTQKAFNIASALIETYAAASSAFRNTLANPINKLLPDAGLLRAKIAAGVATAGGLAQVAAISRQKYQSSSAATPINTSGGAGGGGGSARAEPSFNIVGRSNDNILLSAIQSQFDQPLRAYVVARDVTNQQQLDGVISTAAST